MKALFPILLMLATTLPGVPLFADENAEAALTDAVRAAVAEVAPAVLRVETFGGLQKVGDTLVSSGPSTALAVSEDGFLLCSAYTFAQQPTSVLVTMPSGKRAAAEVVARDNSRMLVLLKVNSEEQLTVPEFVARGAMTVGQTAIAIGRTYDVKAPNISVGILSATNRIWGKAIQTDAKISPANYGGPLIDLHGQVLGILVPMSPQGEGALAGAEWYDSGIGFAVPLAELMPHLDKLKQGEDLHAGKLGVSLAGKDDFSQPVEVAAVLPGSPAAKAGLEKGDHIVQVAGQKIRWLAHLKHALGPRYAGETLDVTVHRNDEQIKTSITLVDDIAPYDVPFLGILPAREFDGPGVKIRYVYDDSPADQAGLQQGDVIQSSAGKAIEGTEQLRNVIGTHVSGEGPIKLTWQRDGKTTERDVELASLPAQIPANVPAAHQEKTAAEQRPPVGLIEVKVPEIANNCYAYVPSNYHPDVQYGLMVWLHAPGEFDKDAIEATWGELSAKHDLIVVSPQAAEAEAWQPTEAEFVRKAIDEVTDVYNIDPARIIAGGYQAGGTFAALVTFTNTELVRGVAMVDAALPGRAPIPASDPVERLAFFIATADDSKVNDRIEAGIKRLQQSKLPITRQQLGDKPSPLNDQQRAELARWVDTLDRI